MIKQNDAELASAVGYKIDNEEILYKAAQEFLVKNASKGYLSYTWRKRYDFI